jgi:MFS family permease
MTCKNLGIEACCLRRHLRTVLLGIYFTYLPSHQDGYTFHFAEENEWTITAEWELVCDRSFLAPLITTTYFCGVMVGGVIFGGLSDKFGRKWMMLVCLYTQCIIGIGIHFVQDLLVFIGLRFVQGIFIQVDI